jgi:glycosidase
MEVRRASPALRRGTLEWLKNSDESRVVTFARRAGDEEVVIAINFSNRPFFGSVEVSNGGKFGAGLPVLSLDAWGYRIFRHD